MYLHPQCCKREKWQIADAADGPGAILREVTAAAELLEKDLGVMIDI